MKKKDEASYGTMLHYSMDGRHGTFVQLRIELDKEISHTEIEQAFEKTCKRFPYFCTTFAEENNCLRTVPNSKKITVHYEEPENVIDYSKNDGFLIRLSVHQNLVIFSFFHGLTDGSGAWNFVRVLLCEYYRNLGESVTEPENIFDINDTPSEEEYFEPMSKVPSKTKSKPVDNPTFRIPGKKTSNYQAYSFTVDQKKMMEYVSLTGGSPNSVTAIAIAEAVKAAYPVNDTDKIGVSIPINAKPFIGMEKTQRTCLSVSIFNFDNDILSLDKKVLNKAVRDQIKEDVKPEKIWAFFASITDLFKILFYINDISAKHLMCVQATTPQIATVVESYVGKISFGSIENHIKSLNSFCDTPAPLVEINFINGKFFYSISSSYEIKPFIEKFYEYFKSLGFDCTEPVKHSLNTYTKQKDPVKLGFNLNTLRMISAVGKFKNHLKKKTVEK